MRETIVKKRVTRDTNPDLYKKLKVFQEQVKSSYGYFCLVSNGAFMVRFVHTNNTGDYEVTMRTTTGVSVDISITSPKVIIYKGKLVDWKSNFPIKKIMKKDFVAVIEKTKDLLDDIRPKSRRRLVKKLSKKEVKMKFNSEE